MGTTFFLTLGILGALVAASVLFNRYVEARHPHRRADGETALWVALGTAYTVAGGLILYTLWSVQLGYPWQSSLVALAAVLAAFIAAGIPMFWGDMRRTQSWRETNEYLDRAERMNGKGK